MREAPEVHAVARAAALVLPIAILVVLVSPVVPASALSFSNTASITTQDSSATSGLKADVYPSTITVSGVVGAISDVNVTLSHVASTYTRGLDVLLVGPHGQTVVLVADAGYDTSLSSVVLTFDDAASAQIPAVGNFQTGTYEPSNLDAFDGTTPAPAGPYGSTLSVFDGTDANGAWNLFVFSDVSGGAQSIEQGWSLDIATIPAPTVTSFAPRSGKVGDPVVISGTSFTGATVVKFGTTAASTFSVDSATQITATVPAGAGAGPISVTTPSGTEASPTSFIVRHGRSISLVLKRHRGKGKVRVADRFGGCASDQDVRIQHREHGHWRLAGEAATKGNGTYQVGQLGKPGVYRAVVKPTTLPAGDRCLGAVSPKVRS